MTTGPGEPGSFHGRRKGKPLRPGHDRLLRDLLPSLRLPGGPLTDLAPLFPQGCETIELEIGFGGGEHLADAATRCPSVGFIGCEPFVNGMAKMLARIEADGIGNVRLWDDDAAELLPRLPQGSLERVYLLFPDPWPKRRQRKRRFVSDERLAQIARTLRPGGEFRFATDIDDYAGWTLARVLRSQAFRWPARGPEDWSRPWPDWIGTRYEGKATREGRPASYLTFLRA